jgi:hypothetical protein
MAMMIAMAKIRPAFFITVFTPSVLCVAAMLLLFSVYPGLLNSDRFSGVWHAWYGEMGSRGGRSGYRSAGVHHFF